MKLSRAIPFALMMIGSWSLTSFTMAGDVARGEIKAAVCVACHGERGNQPIADYPKLAGQDRVYLLHTLRAYQSGARNNAVMTAQMATFTDTDMEDLAAYFAAQEGDLR